MCAVPSAPAAFRVRVWEVMSRGRGPRGGRAVPEGVHVDYALMKLVSHSVMLACSASLSFSRKLPRRVASHSIPPPLPLVRCPAFRRFGFRFRLKSGQQTPPLAIPPPFRSRCRR